jgi:Icc protein
MAATILQLSDTHLPRSPGREVFGADADERVSAVVAAWLATGERADLVLLTGDLADDGDAAAYRRLADVVAGVEAPVLALAGNHDHAEAVAATWGGDDVVEVAGWRIVTVDTTIPGEVRGRVDVPPLLARLDELDDRPTVLALHHPPLSRSTHEQFSLEGASPLLDALAGRPHVRAVVAGHLHDAVDLQGEHGPPVLLCPSTVMGITHDGDEMQIDATAIRGARVIHLGDDGMLTSSVFVA